MRELFEPFRDDPDFYEEFLDFYDGEEDRAKQYFDIQFEAFLDRIRSIKISTEGIQVFRSITANSVDEINLNFIGGSFSYNKYSAHSWYGGNRESFLVEAVVPLSEINLETTLRQNLVCPDEEEIRLESNATVYIHKIYNNEKIVKEFNPPLLSYSGKIGVFGDWNP